MNRRVSTSGATGFVISTRRSKISTMGPAPVIRKAVTRFKVFHQDACRHPRAANIGVSPKMPGLSANELTGHWFRLTHELARLIGRLRSYWHRLRSLNVASIRNLSVPALILSQGTIDILASG